MLQRWASVKCVLRIVKVLYCWNCQSVLSMLGQGVVIIRQAQVTDVPLHLLPVIAVILLVG